MPEITSRTRVLGAKADGDADDPQSRQQRPDIEIKCGQSDDDRNNGQAN